MRLILVIISSLLYQLCSAINYLEERKGGTSNALTRKRRLAVVDETELSLGSSFSITVPLQGLDTSFTGSVPFSYSFNLGGSRRKRSAVSDFEKKINIFNIMESYLPSIVSLPPGSDSHECVLRAICEVARTPLTDDGLLGDFINLILTPLQYEIIAVQNNSDYIKAQHRGKTTQDCSPYQMHCGMSFFEVL